MDIVRMDMTSYSLSSDWLSPEVQIWTFGIELINENLENFDTGIFRIYFYNSFQERNPLNLWMTDVYLLDWKISILNGSNEDTSTLLDAIASLDFGYESEAVS